jgi:hypothetical protein
MNDTGGPTSKPVALSVSRLAKSHRRSATGIPHGDLLMPANVCPACETPWPHNETYKTAWGTKAVRSANATCQLCGIATVYAYGAVPLTELELTELREAHAAQQRRDAFEAWYADREAHKLTEGFDAWLAHGIA